MLESSILCFSSLPFVVTDWDIFRHVDTNLFEISMGRRHPVSFRRINGRQSLNGTLCDTFTVAQTVRLFETLLSDILPAWLVAVASFYYRHYPKTPVAFALVQLKLRAPPEHLWCCCC